MFDLPRTAKGRATRARIVAAAAALVRERGAAETSLDEVIERAGVSKSQLYHYFHDKADLLRAVVTHQADTVSSLTACPYAAWRALRRLTASGWAHQCGHQ